MMSNPERQMNVLHLSARYADTRNQQAASWGRSLLLLQKSLLCGENGFPTVALIVKSVKLSQSLDVDTCWWVWRKFGG